ncbi:MAG: hypothetical protein JNL23_06210 [Chitinophagaceae bacterium]|nr:hypothetical protein [Chitinophagaceae bacterium]
MKKIITAAVSIILILNLSAQQVTKEDYKRAASFLWQNLNNKKIFNVNTQVNWLKDSSGGWFLLYNKEGKTFIKIDPKKGKTEPLFDHQRLAKLIGDILKKEIKPTELPFTYINYNDKIHWEVSLADKNYVLDLSNYTLTPKKEEATPNPL